MYGTIVDTKDDDIQMLNLTLRQAIVKELQQP